MTDSITPLIMLSIFLAGTLWLGMRYKKGNHNIVEYTIGNKTFTIAALVATIVATAYGGGGLIREVEMVYDKGLWYIMLTIGGVIVYTLVGIVVSYRIGNFIENHIPSKNQISMADTIGQIYGKIPRIITALASVGASIAVLAIQIAVTSRILQICISGVSPTILMLISSSIVILYSMFGGIRSVTITDILQCSTFTIMIPYIAYKVFHHTGMSVPQIFKAVLQSEKFQFEPTFRNKISYYPLLAGWLACISSDATSVQRMYMAKNGQQAREAYITSTILRIVMKLIIVFIGIVTCVGYSDLDEPRMIWPAVMSNSSTVFRGFFVISLFAMAMSTADSILNVASSMVAHDIVNPLRKNKLTGEKQLFLAKIACFIAGILAIILTLYTSKYSDALLRLVFLAKDICNPIFVAPFLLAVFGFRCKEKVTVLGMTVGVITITLWNKFIPRIDGHHFDGSFVAMLANGITMILAHYGMKKDRQDWTKPSLDYQAITASQVKKILSF